MKNKNKLTFYFVAIFYLLSLAMHVAAQETIPPFGNLAQEGEIIPSESFSVQEEASKINLNWLYVSLPLLLIFIFLVYLEVKRLKSHKRLMQERVQQNTIALKNYILTNLKKGYSKQQIRNALIKNNYSNEEVEEAFRGIRFIK